MAVAPTIPLTSADEYLDSGYHPDKEYVEGILVERSVPTIARSLLQVLLIPRGVIEILSPDARLSEQLARFRDYRRIGVLQMVLLDPEEFTAYRFDENGSLLETQERNQGAAG